MATTSVFKVANVAILTLFQTKHCFGNHVQFQFTAGVFGDLQHSRPHGSCSI